MTKPFFKKKSKRVTTKKRCKVEKKVREHLRKVRKESKKKAKTSGKGRKPLITVPNKCPFKEDILKEALQHKLEAEEAFQKRKEQLRKTQQKKQISDVLSDALKKQKKFEASAAKKTSDESKTLSEPGDTSFKTYFSEVKKVIDAADVIIEVLDARDPLGSRCSQVEESVRSAGKRLVLLLNKIDLVPKTNVEAWLKYLRNELPTISFKASTQEQAQNLGLVGHQSAYNTSKCVGADLLMKLLGNYCRNNDLRTSIRVGIIGFPNVGKSSVINSLKRSKACNTGAMPGVTKCAQEVELDKKIRLLDSPGVVMATKSGAVDLAEAALKNSVKVETLADPITPIEAILRRCSKENLLMQYNLPDFDDVNEFLSLLGKRIGRLKKGGVPDMKAAARKVLLDWNSGKIRYYTVPPLKESATPNDEAATLFSEMSKEFDLSSIDTDQKLMLQELPDNIDAAAIVMQPTASENCAPMEIDDGDSRFAMEPPVSDKHHSLDLEMADAESTLPGNQQLNKAVKKCFKGDRKKRRRIDNLADNLFNTLQMTTETSTE